MRGDLIKIKIRKRKKVLTMGIYILYNYKAEYNYIYGRCGKRSY